MFRNQAYNSIGPKYIILEKIMSLKGSINTKRGRKSTCISGCYAGYMLKLIEKYCDLILLLETDTIMNYAF